MKKALSFTLIVSILICAVPTAGADNYVLSEWAEPEFNMALEYGTFTETSLYDDYTVEITRKEMCYFLLMAYEKLMGASYTGALKVSPFSDCDDEYVMLAYELGIVSGREDGTFDPDSKITRQEYAVMLANLLTSCGLDIEVSEATQEICFDIISDKDSIAPWAAHRVAQMLIFGYMNGTSPETFEPLGNVTAEQAIILGMRMYAKNMDASFFYDVVEDDVIVAAVNENIEPEITAPSDFYTYNGSYRKNDRSEVFTEGEITTKEFAETQMVEIEIDVWVLKSDGTKVPGKKYLTVNKNIADRTKAVFDEIFNGPEKFPIKSVGGYNWRSPKSSGKLSEHNYGTAIDINPDENYCVYSNGSIVGKYYKPGEDPYSIAKYGDVWNAFVKYGFTWGGDAWRTPQDYMHFSYLGT